jgi:putative SOS response-associated peptidase YedK
MCGRYVSPGQAAIEREWHVGRRNSKPFERRFNVAPTSEVPILCVESGCADLALAAAYWAFVPHWWKQLKTPTFTFNARFEDAATKPMWRTAFRLARCLVPAEGWYEWKEEERCAVDTGEIKRVKQPYFIHRRDRRPFCFAGLMSWWTPPSGTVPRLSCAILTRQAAPSVAAIHDRMPVSLPAEAHGAWLDASIQDAARAITIVKDCAMSDFESHAVSTRVNSSRDDDEELLKPLPV